MLSLMSFGGAHEGHDGDGSIINTYRTFAQAQNARDLDRIGAFFTDRPDLLWVSDGQSFWGRDAVLARMGSFQKAEIWRVTPDLDMATVVDLGPRVAMLHFPLLLEIGRRDAPAALDFLVSLLFRM
jgi:hypothetical protein